MRPPLLRLASCLALVELAAAGVLGCSGLFDLDRTTAHFGDDEAPGPDDGGAPDADDGGAPDADAGRFCDQQDAAGLFFCDDFGESSLSAADAAPWTKYDFDDGGSARVVDGALTLDIATPAGAAAHAECLTTTTSAIAGATFAFDVLLVSTIVDDTLEYAATIMQDNAPFPRLSFRIGQSRLDLQAQPGADGAASDGISAGVHPAGWIHVEMDLDLVAQKATLRVDGDERIPDYALPANPWRPLSTTFCLGNQYAAGGTTYELRYDNVTVRVR